MGLLYLIVGIVFVGIYLVATIADIENNLKKVFLFLDYNEIQSSQMSCHYCEQDGVRKYF